MAAIDKIYGSNEQWEELFLWLARHRPQYIKFMALPFATDDKRRQITNLPLYADKWLWDNCPLKWVKEALKFQYNGSPHKRRPK